MHLRSILAATLLLGVAIPLAIVTPAAAHCDGVTGQILVVDKCIVQTAMEQAVDAFNAAGDGSVVMVFPSQQRWHPENVTVKNGGTVLFVWADVLGSDIHDPRNGASTGNQALDRLKPVPPPLYPQGLTGECFDIIKDQNEFLDKGKYYPVTFRVDPVTHALSVSNSLLAGGLPLLGSPPLTKPFHDCLPGLGSTSPDPTLFVLPYHCGVHGAANTPIKAMRGSITVVI